MIINRLYTKFYLFNRCLIETITTENQGKFFLSQKFKN